VSTERSFLDSLVSNNLLTPEDAQSLYSKYHGNQFLVLTHLFKGSIATKDFLGRLWGDSIGAAYVNLEKTLFQKQVVQLLPEEFARKNKIIPVYRMHGVITVAAADPLDFNVLDDARHLLECPVNAVFSFPDEIIDAIDIQYQSRDSLNKFVGQIADNALFKGTSKITSEQLYNLAGNQSVVEFCRSILLLALRDRASDIHIDPQEDMVYIRFRVDGVLHDRLKIDSALLQPVISRIKVLGSLDIAEKRRPQDGRVSLELTNKSIDFRLSIVPTIYGEKVVLRVLGQVQQDEVADLKELHFSKSNLTTLKQILSSSYGVFFVTGPTGSGKSTTLFSALQYLNKPGLNIMTAEDPVEYRLSRVNQVHINNAIGYTFATALRSFLRQDPDIILIGEIRDLETARITAQAALTGHFVLSTMHTSNALQAITRLVDIGVEPFLVAPSIIGVMGQRLLRKLCASCKQPYNLSPEEIEQYFIVDDPASAEVRFFHPTGCPECNDAGYRGRLAIHEIFIVNDRVRDLVAKNASAGEIKKAARESGFKDMRYDGMKKVLRGLTTIEELNRVVSPDP